MEWCVVRGYLVALMIAAEDAVLILYPVLRAVLRSTSEHCRYAVLVRDGSIVWRLQKLTRNISVLRLRFVQVDFTTKSSDPSAEVALLSLRDFLWASGRCFVLLCNSANLSGLISWTRFSPGRLAAVPIWRFLVGSRK